MNTKRLLISILVLFAGLFSQARTQTTSATPTDFAVLESAATSTGMLTSVSPYLMADNRVPDTRLPVQVVNAWSTGASADSAWAYTKKMRREWIVNLTSWTAADSTFLFTIKEYQSATGALVATYTQFVNYGTVRKQGANWYKGAAHNEANFGSTPLGINLSLANYATMLGAVGWNWHLYLWNINRAGASNGSLATYSMPPELDSLAIYTSGTINRAADTVSTSAFSAKYDYNTIFGKVKGVHATDSVRVGVGIKLKSNALGLWTSPLSTVWKRVSVLNDSVFMPPAVDSLFYYPLTIPGVADSAMLYFWGKSAVDSITLGPIKLGRRN